MTKRVLSACSSLFIAVAMMVVVGCDLDGSDSGSEELAQIDQAIADEQAAQNAAPSSPSTTSSAPASSSGGGSGGFIWKPVSEGDGNLVVLLPGSLRCRVSGADIQKSGSRVEKGRFTGDTHNGNRPHYRFSKPGAGYGSGLTLTAFLSGGGKQSWNIPNGASRYDY